MYGLGAQAGAQPLDEPAGLAREAAAVLAGLPQTRGLRRLRHHARGAQLAGAHRLGQRQRREVLAEQRDKALRISARRRETHQAARRGMPAVHEPTLELSHAALARVQKGAELGAQRRERREQPRVARQLAVELAPAAEAHAGRERGSHFRCASGEPVERGERCRAEAARKAGTRQRSAAPTVRTPRRPSRATVSSGQRSTVSGRGVSCPMSCAGSRISNDRPARAPQSAANGVGAQASCACSCRPRHSPRSAARSRADAGEQVQAAAHLEQQPVRRLEAHARSEALRAFGQRGELRPRGAARQMHAQPQLGRECAPHPSASGHPRSGARRRRRLRRGPEAEGSGAAACAAHSSRQNAVRGAPRALQQRDAHAVSRRLQAEPQHRARGFTRRAARPEQHPERTPVLGGQLQAADVAWPGLPRPGEHRIAGARSAASARKPTAAARLPPPPPARARPRRRPGPAQRATAAAPPTRTSAPWRRASARRAPAAAGAARRCRSGQPGFRSGRCGASRDRAGAHRVRRSRSQSPAAGRRAAAAPDGRMLEQPSDVRIPSHDLSDEQDATLCVSCRRCAIHIRPLARPRRTTPTTMPSMSSGCSLRSTLIGSNSAFSGISHTTEPSWR